MSNERSYDVPIPEGKAKLYDRAYTAIGNFLKPLAERGYASAYAVGLASVMVGVHCLRAAVRTDDPRRDEIFEMGQRWAQEVLTLLTGQTLDDLPPNEEINGSANNG